MVTEKLDHYTNITVNYQQKNFILNFVKFHEIALRIILMSKQGFLICVITL